MLNVNKVVYNIYDSEKKFSNYWAYGSFSIVLGNCYLNNKMVNKNSTQCMYVYLCKKWNAYKVEYNFIVRLGLFIGEIHFHLCGFVGIDVFNKASQLAIVC